MVLDVVSGTDFRGGNTLQRQAAGVQSELNHIPTFGSPSLTASITGRDEDNSFICSLATWL